VKLYIHSPVRLHGAVLSSKHRDKFTFYLYLQVYRQEAGKVQHSERIVVYN